MPEADGGNRELLVVAERASRRDWHPPGTLTPAATTRFGRERPELPPPITAAASRRERNTLVRVVVSHRSTGACRPGHIIPPSRLCAT